ncbi:MAG: hypothetical protein Q9159_000935, partial [Coniocarpon cinnabarinum]
MQTIIPPPISAAAFVAGIATHQLYFKRNEHHLNGVQYFQLLLLALIAAPLHVARAKDGGVKVHYFPSASRWEPIGIFLLGVYTSLLTYRLLFHPLNKFPGPASARVSDLWYSVKCRNKDAQHQLVRQHKQYGEFLRIGSSSLSITHPNAVQAIYGFGSKCTKAYWYDNEHPYTSMHKTRSRVEHDKRRRVWSPAFSDKALRGYEERMRPYGDRLIEQLRALRGTPVDVSEWFHFLTYDMMGDLAFSKSFGMLQDGKEHEAIKLLSQGLDPLGFMFPEWLFCMMIRIPGAAREFWKFIRYSADAIEKRMTQDPHVPDIMTALLAPYQKTGSATDEAERRLLHADSRLVIVAGSDTTAATLTHLFCYLCQHPKYVPILRDELASYIDQNGDAKNVDIASCELLNGCINEALRLSPPVPTMLQRLTPPEGIDIGGHHIAGGCKVWSPQYVISRSERIYKDAESFLSERWSSKPEMVLDGSASFAPFSTGVYGCIGKPLALMEIRTIVAKILTRFDVDFAPGEDGHRLLFETRDHFTLGLAPLKLVFRER